jgi:proline iminopeptidase
MRARYPPIEPYASGRLDVGDGQRVFWEACGNPDGKPAVVLHGGPGSGCTPDQRRFFDPAAYRVILLDQRGCGRSTPNAADPAVGLEHNTTWHLVADLERLRAHLGLDRWLLFGGSWGATLALAYAERHPDRVSEVVLAGVTTTRRSETDWLYRGVGALYPEAYAAFRAGGGEADDLVAAYRARLADPDPAVRSRAADDWSAWELATMDVDARWPPRWDDPAFRFCRARIVTHFFAHGAWLEEDQLLRDAHRLAGIPAVLVHGRRDRGSPLATAQAVAAAWPGAELVVVDDAGHDPGAMAQELVAATDRLAARR